MAGSTPVAAVRIRELHKTFPIRRGLREYLRRPSRRDRLTALDAVSCEVADGEFFGLLGENGAGKTTLFKILSTLTVQDAGLAEVFGVDVREDPRAARRLVAPVLANERSLAWRLSAVENLRLYAALHRIPRVEAESRIRQVLEVVGLAGMDARLAGTFSSGMKQRLLLARALLARPRLLLLDEPTRSLDPLAARSFRDFLRHDIGRAHGCTVLLATHDPEEVRDLCDRVGVLARGRLVATGTTSALAAQLGYHRYRLVTREPYHPAVVHLVQEGGYLGPVEPDEDGWQRRELDVPPGNETSRILSRLVAGGVPIARFERIELPLADLIERLGRPPRRDDA